MNSVLLTIACALAATPSVETTPAVGDRPASSTALDANPIDEHIYARLGELGIDPSASSFDTELLRRLSLTVVGQLPRPEEIRAFVADQRPDKRARKIDELLSHELHAAVWASRYCEWTGNSLETLAGDDESKSQLAQLWHQWLRDRFAKNEPYDRLVRSIVTAQSRNDRPIGAWVDDEVAMINAIREQGDAGYSERSTLDLFWKRTDVEDQYPVREMAERVASVFLGVRINCARCHDHPFDQWTQTDYQQFVRVFEQVRHDLSPELRREIAARLVQRRQRFLDGEEVGPPLPRITEVYLMPRARNDDRPEPKALGGPELDGDQPDLRVALADWMTDPENPHFARNLVNRVWAHYFGRGLIEPLDGLTHGSEGVAYPELLDELAERFVTGGYDIRQLELLILKSTVWQLSSIPNSTNRHDQRYFSRAYVRLPTPETVLDMWHAATGIERDFASENLRGLHAVEIGVDQLPNARWDSLLKLFGQPKRMDTCDCSPKNRPAVRQTLALMCDPHLLADFSGGTLTELLADELTDEQRIDELFLQTLSRWPTDDERAAARQACADSDNNDAWEDILWSLVNCQEFITVH